MCNWTLLRIGEANYLDHVKLHQLLVDLYISIILMEKKIIVHTKKVLYLVFL